MLNFILESHLLAMTRNMLVNNCEVRHCSLMGTVGYSLLSQGQQKRHYAVVMGYSLLSEGQQKRHYAVVMGYSLLSGGQDGSTEGAAAKCFRRPTASVSSRNQPCTRCGKGGRLGKYFGPAVGRELCREVLCTRCGKEGSLGRCYAPTVGRGAG